MSLSTVTWRQTVAALAATCIGLLAVVVVVRADGLPAVDAASARATAWFVHQPTGRAVLVDGYRGAALGSIDAGAQGEEISIAEGAPGAYVLNETTAEARPIDTVDLRLGTAFGLATLGDGQALSAVGQSGLVVVNPDADDATVVPADGEPVSFPVDAGTATQVARDGSIWSLVDGDLQRTTSSNTTTTRLGVDGAELSVVGSDPFVVDVQNRRAFLGSGRWQALPTDADPSEIVVQVPGPAESCGWVAANDDLWCVGEHGIEFSSTIEGLDVDGGDLLGIAGDAAALIRRGPSSIVRFDWRAGEILAGGPADNPATVAPDAALQVTATTDLIWIDDVAGQFVWAVNPWTLEAIDKDPNGILVLGEDGNVVDAGESGQSNTSGSSGPDASEPDVREPDDNGVDDPPVAVDDPVTARAGASVTVEVTANDHDPDGEAIAVSAVGVPGHGSVDIGTASTVVYTPDAGFVGVDQVEYTIVDGNGTTDTATVIIELLATDSTNKPPVGITDHAETGAGVAVVVDVLLNDVDPERDALRIGGFSPPETSGVVTETVGPSGLPALRFEPAEGFEGTAIFSYRPIDSFEAVGDDVEVRVEVARPGDPNRPPVVGPDAVRVRRNIVKPLLVLLNDDDPDGDTLALSVVEPVPAGLEVRVEGAQLSVVARAGAPSLAPFLYEVDDGHGHVVRGAVLVSVIDEIEPNRPPVAGADSAKAVIGDTVTIAVTSNDTDPDDDPLTVVDVTQPENDAGQVVVFSRDGIQFTPSPLGEESRQSSARFTYTVSDGNGHEVVGDVTVTVLPEALVEPPYARDDSTFTFENVPVTVDVLRNDGDPSGRRPTLFGRPGCPGGGRATVTTDSQVRFDPPVDETGAFRCTYEVTNSSGGTASASIIISVREPQVTNAPPVALSDSIVLEVGTSETIDVTTNDSDPDGANAALEVVSSTAPTLGTAQRDGNLITFTAGSETGNATINYQVADAEGAVSLGRLLITVTEKRNVAPIAVGDAQTIFGPGVPTQFSVLANDRDPDETPGGLSVVSATKLSGDGSVSVSGNIVTISPEPSFIGQVIATYTIRDGEGLSTTANVTLDIQTPPNRPPDARDDSNEVVNGGSVSSAVLFNDVDLDGDSLSLSIVSGPDPSLGSANVGSGQSINFNALPGAAGTAVIGYRVSDGTLTDDAVLRINVLPCRESAPIADSGLLKTGYQQPIAVDLSEYGRNGSIVDVAGPAGFDGGVYTPPAGMNGNAVITYRVVNTCRLTASGQITIDVNQDPVAQPVAVQVTRGTQMVIPVTDLATDQEALTITDTGSRGWATATASSVVLEPKAGDANGNWTWTVKDPGGLTTTVTVSATIVDPPPVAVDDQIDASLGISLLADLIANDRDPGQSGLDFVGPQFPITITFSNGVDGRVDGGPRAAIVTAGGGQGTATFTYTIKNAGGTSTATVTVRGPDLPATTTTTTLPPTTSTTTTTVPPTTSTTTTTTTTSTTTATTTTTSAP